MASQRRHRKRSGRHPCDQGNIQTITRRDTGLTLLRKEVIQPHLPVRLPCYDLAPVTRLTLTTCPPKVGTAASGTPDFHRLTGGVYKARERIHRAVADTRLLAIPTSWSRVADSNPNWERFWGSAPPCGVASHWTVHCSTCAALDVRAMMT